MWIPFLQKLNQTFLLGGLSVSGVSSSSSSSSSLCSLVLWLAAAELSTSFEHVDSANGDLGGPEVEGPGAMLVSIAMR